MKIYRTKLSEVKKLLKEQGGPREIRPLGPMSNNLKDEEMDRKMEIDPLSDDPDVLAGEVVDKIQKIMTNLSMKLHDMTDTNEKAVNKVIEYLDRELGEKVVSMMW